MFKLNIKEIRTERCITQEELAFKCGLSQSYIACLERPVGRMRSPRLETIETIARALETCPMDLLTCTCSKCKKVG